MTFIKGLIPWNKGTKGISVRGEKVGTWKGDKAKYRAKHMWINHWFGKADKCENESCIYPRKDIHGKIMIVPKRFEWANISRGYKRDRKDWRRLCPSCHKKYDIAYKKNKG